jgi:hypothetical protein
MEAVPPKKQKKQKTKGVVVVGGICPNHFTHQSCLSDKLSNVQSDQLDRIILPGFSFSFQILSRMQPLVNDRGPFDNNVQLGGHVSFFKENVVFVESEQGHLLGDGEQGVTVETGPDVGGFEERQDGGGGDGGSGGSRGDCGSFDG